MRLSADSRRKGRYAPLTALVPRVGANALLALQPGLPAACMAAMEQHIISSAVAGTLLALVAQLQREATVGRSVQSATAAAGGAPGGDCRRWWLPQLATALRCGSEQRRDNLAVHLLPALLSLDPPALGLLLRALLGGAAGGGGSGGAVGGQGAAAASLAVLKAARKQHLLTELHEVEGVAGACVQVHTRMCVWYCVMASFMTGHAATASWRFSEARKRVQKATWTVPRLGRYLDLDGALSRGQGCLPDCMATCTRFQT